MEDKITHSPAPKLIFVTEEITNHRELSLQAVEYENAITISIYIGSPKIGSMTMAFILGDIVERNVIFSGRHETLANAASQLICKKTSKMIYASVFFAKDVEITFEQLHSLINKYLQLRKDEIDPK